MGKEHPDLYSKVLKGGVWAFALKAFTQIMSIARLTILARLLSKTDFGIMGIALLLIGILETVTQTGFQTALIQKNKDITPYLDTAWTVNIVRASLLYAILYFAAPLVANVKMQPEQVSVAIAIIRIAGLSIIIGSFSNIGTVYFQKELLLNKTFTIASISNIIGMVASIIVAMIYKNPWALVVGKLANTTTSVFISYRMHTYRPKLRFDNEKFVELWKFGRWLTAGSVFDFIMNHGDDIFVWMYLGPSFLGYYQMAYRIANLPATEITELISNITFPAYSKLNNDLNRLKAAYIKSLTFVSLVAIPVGFAIFILSDSFIKVFMGNEWEPIIIPVKLLAFFGICRAIGSTRGPIFNSINLPNINLFLRYIRLSMLIVTMIPLTFVWGINGTSLSVLLVGISTQLPGMLLIRKHIGLDLNSILKCSLSPMIWGITAVCAAIIIDKIITNHIFYNFAIRIFICSMLMTISLLKVRKLIWKKE